MPTHTISRRNEYSREGVRQIVYTADQSITAGAEMNLDESFTNATDALTAFVLDVSQLKMFAIWSTGGNMTVETNSSSSPINTFTLVDGVPQIWSISQTPALTNPITADITAIYVTNTGTAVLSIRSLYDPTV